VALTRASFAMISGSPVNVIDYVTGGSGTAADPYVGWDTTTPWAANTEFKFPSGVFQYNSTLNLAYAGIYLHGANYRGTVLKFTGSGNCISFDGGVTGFNNPHLENLTIEGNPSATNGIYTDNAQYGVLKNIVIRNVSGAGLRSLFGVYWHIEDFFMGNNLGTPGFVAQTTFPAVGIFLGVGGDPLKTVTAYTIINANIADCVNSGIDIANGWMNTIVGGAVEANGDQGLYLGADSHDNLINGLYVEANGTENIVVNGSGENLVGLWCVDGSNKRIRFTASSNSCHIFGGIYGDVTIQSGATRNVFTNTRIAGTWSDSGTGTAVNNVFSFGSPQGFIHPTFISSWTNNATFPYETFTSSGANITSAINSSGYGIANSNVMKLQGGATYLFQWNITLNSGTLPGYVVSTNTSQAAVGVSVAGNNVYMFTPGSDGDYYFTLRTEDGVAANYSCSGVNVKQIN
jgi:hypothetical protein